MSSFEAQRKKMVEEQLIDRDITDQRVLKAMLRVPRELFLPASHRPLAYSDRPVPIGFGQTMSQPYMVALMLEALELGGSELVLDVGTGSGYQAALLGELAEEVYSVELIPELAASAADNLRALNYLNVHVLRSSEELGWPRRAPYDAINVAAAAPSVPPELIAQLGDPARMVIPIGPVGAQSLMLIEKRGGAIYHADLGGCAFVPLLHSAKSVAQNAR